jgi:hypothetical protein
MDSVASVSALRQRLAGVSPREVAEGARVRLRAFLDTPYAWILVAYVLIRLSGFYGVHQVSYLDTDGYLEVTGHPVWSLDFFAGGRPWTVPLLWKLLPASDVWRARGHFGLSLVCWPVLAWAVARCLRPGLMRYLGFGAVLIFSMSFPIIRWDDVMLSESVSLSLTALVVAAWLELVRLPRPAMVVAVLVTTLFWVFARDSNGIIALGLVPVAALWAWRPGPLRRPWALGLAGGLLLIFVASYLATTTDPAKLRRNQRPILHVIGRRVLTAPDEERYFRKHGMPAPPPLIRAQRRSLAGVAEGQLPSNPAADRFIEWSRKHGRSVLAGYLLRHPVRTFKQTFRNRQRLLAGVTVGYTSPNARRLLPAPIDNIAYPRGSQDVWFWLVVVCVGALAVWRRLGAHRFWLVPAVALLLQLPHAVVVYEADTLEIPRHAVLVAVMTRLSLLLLALFAIDAIANRKLGRSGRMYDGRAEGAG